MLRVLGALGGVARRFLIDSLSLEIYVASGVAGEEEGEKNSPGRRRDIP